MKNLERIMHVALHPAVYLALAAAHRPPRKLMLLLFAVGVHAQARAADPVARPSSNTLPSPPDPAPHPAHTQDMCTVGNGCSQCVEGSACAASGPHSFAAGRNASASGNASVALGNNTVAGPGRTSTALGYSTTASGTGSTAMGGTTTASGYGSTAMGVATTASGEYSTAMGGDTTASGYGSTAMGASTTASGEYPYGGYSTAVGEATHASGLGATAMGVLTVASGAFETVVGVCNEKPATNDVNETLFRVGNGPSPNQFTSWEDFGCHEGRSDALRVERDGRCV